MWWLIRKTVLSIWHFIREILFIIWIIIIISPIIIMNTIRSLIVFNRYLLNPGDNGITVDGIIEVLSGIFTNLKRSLDSIPEELNYLQQELENEKKAEAKKAKNSSKRKRSKH